VFVAQTLPDRRHLHVRLQKPRNHLGERLDRAAHMPGARGFPQQAAKRGNVRQWRFAGQQPVPRGQVPVLPNRVARKPQSAPNPTHPFAFAQSIDHLAYLVHVQSLHRHPPHQLDAQGYEIVPRVTPADQGWVKPGEQARVTLGDYWRVKLLRRLTVL
jgi:hypothetical protein